MTDIGDCPMNNRFAPVFLIAGILLAGCSGSGGNSAVNPVPFTAFSAIQTNQPVTASGISQTVSATTLGGPRHIDHRKRRGHSQQ